MRISPKLKVSILKTISLQHFPQMMTMMTTIIMTMTDNS